MKGDSLRGPITENAGDNQAVMEPRGGETPNDIKVYDRGDCCTF